MNMLRSIRCRSLWIATALTAGAVLLPALPAANAETGEQVLEQTSRAFTQIARDAIPAVVFIQVEKTVQVRGGNPYNNPYDFFGDEFLRRFFYGQQTPPRQFRQEGAGTGFLISDDGYILSNNHVVGDADKITVRLHDGREFEAERVGTDPKTEVAVIKIDGEDLPHLSLGDSSEMEVGEWVVAVGNPFGLTETLTAGIVSAKGRSNIGIADYEDFIQTDAAINPGNSGGPLLNIDGKVIGINTAIYSRSGGYMGIGFAIPINMARRIKDQLIEHGEVVRGFLGVVIQDIDRGLARMFDLDTPDGILIAEVMPDSPADEAGLQQGDVILELEGKPVEDVNSFRNAIAGTPPDTPIDMTVLRDGRERNIEAKTTQMDRDRQVARDENVSEETLGLAVQELTNDLARRFGYEMDEGVLISEVRRGSRAAEAGLRPGMLISSVNRQPVSTVEEYRDALAQAGDTVMFLVRDQRGSRFVALDLED